MLSSEAGLLIENGWLTAWFRKKFNGGQCTCTTNTAWSRKKYNGGQCKSTGLQRQHSLKLV